MSQHAPRKRLTLGFQALVAMVLAALLVVSAGAAPPDKRSGRTSYLSAGAWSDTAYFNLTSNSQGTWGYLSFFDGGRSWDGYFSTSPDAFSVRGNLHSAQLEPTTVPVQSFAGEECYYGSDWDYWYCYPVYDYQEVSLSAAFEGTGEVLQSAGRSKYETPYCSYTFSGRTRTRSAAVSLTVGELTQTMTDGYLLESRETYREKCK